MAMGAEMASALTKTNGEAHDVATRAAAAGCPAHAHSAEPTTMRVRVDRDLCQGHAVCVGEAPEVFALGKDNKVMLKMARPPAELHAKVRAAVEHCPTRTLRIEE
jgi:sterol 14-demethylase